MKESRRLVLIGGGGHCRSVISCLDRTNYAEIVICDRKEKIGEFVAGIPIRAADEDLEVLFRDGYAEAFITLGTIRADTKRRKIFDGCQEIGFRFPDIIAPSAEIAENVELSDGVFIGKGAIVNIGSRIGSCAIINTGAIIEHDCSIGAFSHIGPGTVMSGGVFIGENSLVGTGTSIRQGCRIGSNTSVGAGSVVVSDIPDACVAFGVPCKKKMIDE